MAMAAAFVVMAIMAFAFMVVVMAFEIKIHGKFAGQPVFHNRADLSGRAADDATADAAANQDGHFFLRQQPRQGAMAAVAAGFHAFRENLAVFHIINREFGRMPEMLEHRSIFTCHRNFHLQLQYSA